MTFFIENEKKEKEGNEKKEFGTLININNSYRNEERKIKKKL